MGQGLGRDAEIAALVAATDDAIIGKTPDGLISSWNPAAERMFGYAPEEIIGRPVRTLVAPGKEDEEDRLMQRLREGGRLVQYETTRRRKDGSLVDVSLTISPIRDPTGRLMGFVKVARDITSLKESQARLAEIQAIAQLGTWSWEIATGRVEWSEETFRLLGHTAGEFTPTFDRLVERMVPEDGERFRQEVEACIAGFEPPQRDLPSEDFRVLLPDGRKRVLHRIARMTGVQPGRPSRLLGMFQDVTLARETERLARERDELKRLDAFKSEFIGKAAHELRTPLLPIQIQTHLLLKLLDPKPESREQKALDSLQRNLERLNRLIDDLLDASRLQSERLRLVLMPFDLSALVDEVAESFAAVAAQLDLRLVWRRRPGVPIEADPQRIIQVLHNLLGNAMKFTPAGGTVTIELQRDASQARLAVRDTGAGLLAEELPGLFQPFQQAAAGKVSRAPGTGLGLYIAKGIMEQHGGRIWAESAGPGQGASFMLELPLTAKSPQPLTASVTSAGWWRDGAASERSKRYRELI